ncbi:hypothetical protein ACQ1Q1_11790, partial [Ornithobacterium rhinotracheale]
NMINKIKFQRVHSEYYVVNVKAFILTSPGEWVTPFDPPTEAHQTAFKTFIKPPSNRGNPHKLPEGRKLIV